MKHSSQGFTWLEALIALVLIIVLLALALPSTGPGLVRGVMTQTLSNQKQLHLAMNQQALDAGTDPSLPAWTCSNSLPLTLPQWKAQLVPTYLTAADFEKLTTSTQRRDFWFDKTITNSLTVFAVTAADPGDTLLFATKNWHGPNLPLSGEPYDQSGFVIFHKGGDGAILLPKQSTNLTIIGNGGSHHFLPLQ